MTLQVKIVKEINSIDLAMLKKKFLDQDEFIVIENLLTKFSLDAILEDLECLRPAIHRNFIPNHKKGGSVSRFEIDRLGTAIPLVYQDPSLFGLLNDLAGGDLQECPEDDPHTYALYCYTEKGDHIGYHYDNSYYNYSRNNYIRNIYINSDRWQDNVY